MNITAIRRTAAIILLLLLPLAAAACSSAGKGKAGGAVASITANPTASADIAQVKKIFQPCLDATASHPIAHAISCSKSKVPAVQDKKTRHQIFGKLANCLFRAYNAAGSFAAFKTGDGWPACVQAAYNAAIAAGNQS